MQIRSTIVIPVFNTGILLKETVECAITQSGGKDEIIIVDDASTDKTTLDIIRDIQINSNVKIIRHEQNRGLGASRNTGVKNATAEIIVPLDSDDLIAPGYFENMLSPFSDPEVAFTYCDVQCFGESNELWVAKSFKEEYIIKSQYICGCSPFRKKIHEAVGGYCEEEIFRKMNEDWDFWLSVCEKGYKGVYVPGGYYLYRRHKSTMSTAPRTFSPSIQQRMLERHRDFIIKYMTPKHFMAHSYKEAGFAYLELNKPTQAAEYAWKLLTTPGWRKDGILLFLRAMRKSLT